MSDKPKMSSGREGPSGSRGRARQNVSSDRRAAATGMHGSGGAGDTTSSATPAATAPPLSAAEREALSPEQLANYDKGMDLTGSYNRNDAWAATAGGTELTSNQMMAKMTQMNMQANANAVVMADKDKDTGLGLQDGSRVKKVVG